ncbi:MAG TPA: hypothetical protein VIK16_07470 [Candidatus Limnocylindrales bacterium]
MTGSGSSEDDLDERLRALKGEVIDGPAPVGRNRSGAAGGNRSGPTGGSRLGAEHTPGGATGRPGSSKRPGAAARAVGWSLGQAEAGRLGFWIGVGLLAIGTYLVLEQFVPAVRILGSLGLALAGGVLLAWVATGRAGAWALNVGAILAGYGAFRFAAEVAGLRTVGWGTLGAGLGLLVLAALRMRRGGRFGWQAWVGAFFVVWGGWGALGSVIPGFPSLGDLLVPGLVVLAGVVILRRGIAPRR